MKARPKSAPGYIDFRPYHQEILPYEKPIHKYNPIAKSMTFLDSDILRFNINSSCEILPEISPHVMEALNEKGPSGSENPTYNVKAGWMNGVFGCLRPVLSMLVKNNGAKGGINQDKWEVPYENIQILEFLGRGGQGTVHLAMLNNEYVAVKKVSELKETDIRNLRKLNHPNIVKFKGVCTHPNNFYIIMEYCAHGPLYELLRNQGDVITPFRVTKWAREISSGMQYLHSHKIIHRDLKSPNVLIGENEVIRISDFGTSRTWNEMSTKMSFAGTVAWMAPEAITEKPCSEKIDVWSFGIVLWEMLTCETPYKDMEQSAIMYLVGSGQLHPPIPSSCPDGFKLIMQMCWKFNPKDRPNFRLIYSHLEIASAKILSDYEHKEKQYFENQKCWKEEIGTKIASFNDNMKTFCLEYRVKEEEFRQKCEVEFKQIEEIRKTLQCKLDAVLKLQVHYETVIKEHKRIFNSKKHEVVLCKKRFFPHFIKRIEKGRGNQDSSTTPTSPEGSITSPDTPHQIPTKSLYIKKKHSSPNRVVSTHTSRHKRCFHSSPINVHTQKNFPPSGGSKSSLLIDNETQTDYMDISENDDFSNVHSSSNIEATVLQTPLRKQPQKVVLHEYSPDSDNEVENGNVVQIHYMVNRQIPQSSSSETVDEMDEVNKNAVLSYRNKLKLLSKSVDTSAKSNGNLLENGYNNKIFDSGEEATNESFTDEDTCDFYIRRKSVSRKGFRRQFKHHCIIGDSTEPPEIDKNKFDNTITAVYRKRLNESLEEESSDSDSAINFSSNVKKIENLV